MRVEGRAVWDVFNCSIEAELEYHVQEYAEGQELEDGTIVEVLDEGKFKIEVIEEPEYFVERL